MARTREGGIKGWLDLGTQRAELVETGRLVGRYVVQETVEPLKLLAKRAALALAGTFVLAVGLVVLGICLLRVLQGDTGGTFAGSWNFAPYLLTGAAAVLVVSLAAALLARSGRAGRQ